MQVLRKASRGSSGRLRSLMVPFGTRAATASEVGGAERCGTAQMGRLPRSRGHGD